MKNFPYILGLDLGETSLGWCILELNNGIPCRIERTGVRIFPDGREDKSKEPLAVTRRTARGARRRRDRFLQRRKKLMNALIRFGLMPEKESERKALETLYPDPYKLRAKAVNEKISAYELGRILFHINQRRGFKSNLKTDKKDAETGAMKTAISETLQKIKDSGALSLGEYLYSLNKDKPTHERIAVRAKSVVTKGKASYPLYPDRKMYEDEVRLIFEKQETPKEIADTLFDIIFSQRPLKQPELGFCQFEDGKRRAYCAFPAYQKFRAMQQVNQLVIMGDETQRILTEEERDALYHYLLVDFSKLDAKKRLLTWAAAKKILKEFGVNPKIKFNLESEKRKGLDAASTSARLSDETCFGKEWFKFDSEKQNEIVSLLLDAQDFETLVRTLTEKYDLPVETAQEIANVSLEDGTGSVSLEAIEKMNPFLEQGFLYNQAVEAANYTFSLKTKDRLPEEYDSFINPETGEIFDELPYYGEALKKQVIGGTFAAQDKNNPELFFGKINNPTVHIALNQVRKLINEIVKTYGHPSKIVVELARTLKLSKKDKDELNKKQAQNTKENDKIAKELERIGVKNSYDNRMKYKLWEDLSDDVTKRCCPFCGKQIGSTRLLFSEEFEIEHLLPFSRSYMDSRTNKVISCRSCNREKGNNSPWEAFHKDAKRWNEILARVENFSHKADEHHSRAKKFREDAFQNLDDVLARMLTDTQYMARIARQYLCFAAHPTKVRGIPGGLTSKLRHHWGLESLFRNDEKDRTDHRHHAIDAFVVACTDAGTLQKYATERRDYRGKNDLLPQEKAPHLPYPDFRLHELQEHFDKIVISYKPDTGNAAGASKSGKTVARLHEDTFYGMGGEGDKKGTWKLVQRVPVSDFKTEADLDVIVDQKGTANPIRSELAGKPADEQEAVIAAYFERRNIKKVRKYRERGKDVILPFKDKNGKEYKYAVYGGNAYAEIYCPDRGKNAGKWQLEIIPNYCAHQKDFLPKWRHTDAHAKLIMRLHINDMVAYEKDGETVIAKVKKMGSGKVYVRENKIAKEDGDKLSWAAYASGMQERNLRKIKVDMLGRVWDKKKPE